MRRLVQGTLPSLVRHLELARFGLGVCNPRTDEVESVDFIAKRIREALKFWSPEKIFLNPDCGFGCFANRCVNEEQIAVEKLKAMVAAANLVRAEVEA